MRGTRKIKDYEEQFMQLYNEGKRDFEIAEALNFTRTTICAYRRHVLHLEKRIANEDLCLTDSDKEILVGTLLGDAAMGFCSSRTTVRVQITHTERNLEYLCWFKKQMPNLFMYEPYITKNKNMFIKGKTYKRSNSYSIYSCKAKCFNELYEVFYPNGKKIIPIDYVEKHFTNKSLAVLFMDEGCKNQDSINLNMQSYPVEQLQMFIDFLYKKFGIEFIMKKDKTLYLRYRSRKVFYDIVKDYVTNDMKYKLNGIVSSLNPVKQGNSRDGQSCAKPSRN